MTVPEYVALLRAVNVAGHVRVPMSAVRQIFEGAGGRNVRTLLHSGNIIFEAPRTKLRSLLRRVRAAFRDSFGAEPQILLKSTRAISRLSNSAPFLRRPSRPDEKLYVAFLWRTPTRKPELPIVDRKEALQAVAIKGTAVFVISRRKANNFFGLPNNFVERQLGVTATTRNWSTVQKMLEVIR